MTLPRTVVEQLQELRPGVEQERLSARYVPMTGRTFGLVTTSARVAFKRGKLTITELERGAEVPELEARNTGDVAVLLVPGEELVGGLQDRVVNAPVVLMPNTTTRVPVSCIEQGRWAFRDVPDGFLSKGRCAPLALRHGLYRSTTASLRRERTRSGSQGDVWREVERESRRRGVRSRTDALSEVLDAASSEGADWRSQPEQVGGLLVEPGGVLLELFGSPESFNAHGPPSSGSRQGAGRPEVEPPDDLLGRLVLADWTCHPGVGAGTEHRARVDRADVVALTLAEGLIYLSAAMSLENRRAR